MFGTIVSWTDSGRPHGASRQSPINLFKPKQLDLIGEARAVEGHQGVVALVGRTAKTVLDHDCAIPMVDSIEHRRQHADIRLRPRDDEAADFLFCEEGLQRARKEGGITRLVDDRRGRDEASER